MADRVMALTVTENTQFNNIGSVSKVFTAAAVMQLVEEKKLVSDKPVVDYLPDFTMADSRYKDITVRMLLNHTGVARNDDGQWFCINKRSQVFNWNSWPIWPDPASRLIPGWSVFTAMMALCWPKC